MSIYSKQMNSLDYSDIALLLSDEAKENVRLEFKREYPSKEETLKKISSMANTWGGYLVIGIAQNAHGKASELIGVEPLLGFQQQIIEWCYGGIYPPISPIVSPPIPKDSGPNKVFYVIYVHESYDAPHFLNGRKGCYVRTDEFSQLFEPRLATYNEILHLSNRRQLSIETRESIIARAKSRFETHIHQNYTTYKNVVGNIDITVWIAITPTFPSHTPLDISLLNKAVSSIRLPSRQTSFPSGDPSTQTDGFYFPNPRGTNFSYLEVNNNGLIFYSQELGYVSEEAAEKLNAKDSTYQLAPSDVYIYSSWVIAWLIFYIKYALDIYQISGYEGPLTIRLGLDRINGRKIRIPRNKTGSDFEEGIPVLDSGVSVEKSVDTHTLQISILDICKEFFRSITFACGWRNAYLADNEFIDYQIDRALDYLMWNRDIFQP